MQISRIRLSDKTSRLCFRVQRHLQFLNPSWSLYVAQSPRFFTTYCVCLELRPLPSTGITRFQRYYEPLRHPKAPGLSLAGFQLVIALTTPWGFPCCVRFPRYMLPPLPRRSVWAYCFRSVTQPCQPSPKGLSGRPAHCPFSRLAQRSLSLRPAHSRCHQFRDTHSEGFSQFVTSLAAPVASGWSGRRVGLAPTGKRRLVTAHTRSGHSPGAELQASEPQLSRSR